MGRRRAGALLTIEVEILDAGLGLRRAGVAEFHGFELAKRIADAGTARRLTSHGTLYKALGRLEDAGLLESRWEDADAAAEEGRPRRRFYTVTGLGERRLAAWRQEHAGGRAPGQPGWEAGR